MRKAELDEIRAIVRAQMLEAIPPERKRLFGGVKSLLKKADASPKRPPLNLTPIDLTPASEQAAPEFPAAVPPRGETPPVIAEADAPMLFLAPKRARFGLADEGARPVSEPRLSFKATLEVEEDLDFQPRRRGASLAATEAAGVGADEILELHEMLSERMPQLLSQIDLDAKLEQLAPQPPADDQPSIADVVASIEAARAGVERAAVREAWAEAKTALSAVRRDRSEPAAGRRRRLAHLHAELTSHHAELDGDLQAVRRARSRPMQQAA